jgi:hypothetical protein
MGSFLKRTVNRVLGIERLFNRIRIHRERLEADVRRELGRNAAYQLHSRDSMEAALNGPYGRLALVTAMPPSQTGISFFSSRFALENAGEVDVFSEYDSVSDYDDQRGLAASIRIFPAALLNLVHRQANYQSIVFSFGNSHHNLFVVRRMLKFASSDCSAKIVVEVHDPFCTNIAYLALSEVGNFDIACKKAYGLRVKRADLSRSSSWTSRNICGVKAILKNCKFDEIIVHSARARDMILDDFGSEDAPRLKVGFHPVFRPHVALRDTRKVEGLTIASFGIPGRGKYVEEVIKVFVRLMREGLVSSAVICGYHAFEKVSEIVRTVPEEITVISDPTDTELYEIMAQTDIAVQLRKRDLGESSGVVPQLLSLGKTVICSRVGTFTEYGEAVRYVTGPVTAASIYESIFDALNSSAENRAAINDYVESHRSEDLLRLILGD